MKENIVDIAADGLEVVTDYLIKNELGEGLIADVPVFGLVVKGCRAVRDFRNIRLMHRIEKLLRGVADTKVNRDEFFSRFQNEKQRKSFCSHLVNAIDALTEEEKVDIEINLFRAFLLNKMDAGAFRRFTHLAETCFYSDLCWLVSFEGRIYSHESIELQGLIGTCLVEQAGIDGGTATPNSGGYYYRRTETGKLFCAMAFTMHTPLDINL